VTALLTVPWKVKPFTSTPWALIHIARYEDTSGGEASKDPHGNWPVAEEPPVVRTIYAVTQFGRRGSSRIVKGPEFQERTETILHVAVPDPTDYSTGDQVILFPQFDEDGNYVPESGVAYWVDGEPVESRMSPWPRYTMQFGGVLKVNRTT
jgi:hypothetical protein